MPYYFPEEPPNPAYASPIYVRNYVVLPSGQIIQTYHIARELPAHVVAACLLAHMDYDARLTWFQGMKDVINSLPQYTRYVNAINQVEKLIATLQKYEN